MSRSFFSVMFIFSKKTKNRKNTKKYINSNFSKTTYFDEKNHLFVVNYNSSYTLIDFKTLKVLDVLTSVFFIYVDYPVNNIFRHGNCQ